MNIKGFLKASYVKLRNIIIPSFLGLEKMFHWLNNILSIVVISMLVYHVGTTNKIDPKLLHEVFYLAFFSFLVGFVFILRQNKLAKHFYFLFFLFLLQLAMAFSWLLPIEVVDKYVLLQVLHGNKLLFSVILLQSLVKLSETITHSLSSKLNPTLIFILSFALLIFGGAGALMLPNSTTTPIRFIDALFTSTSAVCVTGLTVVDTQYTFTEMGKVIIAALIQLGGIGIMTFTSFFGLFFIGKHMSQNKMMIKEIIDPDTGSSQIMKTLRNIILITFCIELIGGIAIYISIGGNSPEDVKFAAFHSISAYCNAGFSTLSQNLFDSSVRFNYNLHLIIATLIIMGGIGFPILFNLIRYFSHLISNLFKRIKGLRYHHIPHLVTVNTVIVLVVTSILLVSGTVAFFFTEYNNTLAGMSFSGKLTTAFFMSVTPRTAGFNTVDQTQLTPLTILLTIFFMWVGASPMSTGGGIKTTTFGLAFLNIWYTLRGKRRIEIRHRQLSNNTVNRSFIIIFVSILLLSIGVTCISAFDPHVPLNHIIYEAVSAMSTVGLSINLTPTLSDNSRIVLILLMYIGRVGSVALLTIFIKPSLSTNYRYPTESIIIN